MSFTAIYGLFDPRDPNVIMYVGKGLANRAGRHWRQFALNNHAGSNQLRRWFERLKSEGVQASWRFIEENVPIEKWQEREMFWIAWWREFNPLLCNILDGGDSFPFDIGRKGAEVAHRQKDVDGKSIAAKKGAAVIHSRKDVDGKSIVAKKGGTKGVAITNSMKDPDGKSHFARIGGCKAYAAKDADGKSLLAKQNAHKKNHAHRGLYEPACAFCRALTRNEVLKLLQLAS